jgi:hypothetical protein
VLEVNAKYDEFVNHLYFIEITLSKKHRNKRIKIYSSRGFRRRRRHTATANKQQVTAQNNPARPAKTPIRIGVQFEDDGDDADNVDVAFVKVQNSPVYGFDGSAVLVKH